MFADMETVAWVVYIALVSGRSLSLAPAYYQANRAWMTSIIMTVQTAFNPHPSNLYAPVLMEDFNVDLDTNNPNDLDRQQQVLVFMAANGEL